MNQADPSNAAEQCYAARLDAAGIPWKRPPYKTFRFNGTSYTPDFYLPIQGVYVEVVGTKQRWSQLKSKILEFKQHHPSVVLQIVDQDGVPRTNLFGGKPRTPRSFMSDGVSVVGNRVKEIRKASKIRQGVLARLIGTSAAHLCEIEHEHVRWVRRQTATDMSTALGVELSCLFPELREAAKA